METTLFHLIPTTHCTDADDNDDEHDDDDDDDGVPSDDDDDDGVRFVPVSWHSQPMHLHSCEVPDDEYIKKLGSAKCEVPDDNIKKAPLL